MTGSSQLTAAAASARTSSRTAYANNEDFLALSPPTQAQVVAQVNALTRQVNALIRLQVPDLLDTP
jgi:hypothetical protein